MGNGQIDRRAFLGAGAAGCAGLILGTTRAWASDTKPGAIVETSYGRIRGLVIDKLEIPFVMENVDEARGMTGEGKDRYALQDKISAAWTNFARTGNPNHKGLPNWPAFDTTKRATMLLNNDSRVANDPNGEERRLVASLRRA